MIKNVLTKFYCLGVVLWAWFAATEAGLKMYISIVMGLFMVYVSTQSWREYEGKRED